MPEQIPLPTPVRMARSRPSGLGEGLLRSTAFVARWSCSSHEAPTRAGLVRAYGYLLEFSCRNALFNKGAMVAEHVTPEIVDAFLSELRDRVGSVTRVVYISRIRTIARISTPGTIFLGLEKLSLTSATNKASTQISPHRLLRTAGEAGA
jgi:hypothetical protein